MKTIIHAAAAVAVIGIAAGTALAIEFSAADLRVSEFSNDSEISNGPDFPNAPSYTDIDVKTKGVGRRRCRALMAGTGEIYFGGGFEAYGNYLIAGLPGAPSADSFFYVGHGENGKVVRYSTKRMKVKYISKKDEFGDEFMSQVWSGFFEPIMNSIDTASVPVGKKKKGKSATFDDLPGDIELTTMKISGGAKVFQDFSRYTGKIQIKAKGTTTSGENEGAKVSVKAKIVFKNVERAF